MPRTRKIEKKDDELNATSASTTKPTRATSKKTTAETKKVATKKTSTKASSVSAGKKKATSKTSSKPVSKKTKKTSSSETAKKSKPVVQTKPESQVKDNLDSFHDLPEYYDLPYRYGDTVVTVLAQKPNTLFVYWDVSDEDINRFKKTYGENFFNITKPVLLVHNLTEKYTFEVDVNDFANNWYINVNDSKCNYLVELCRKPTQSNEIENLENKDFTNIVYISYSNTVEIPNDHIMFFKNNEKIYFKNIKTNNVIEKVFKTNNDMEKVKAIYNGYNLSENASEDRFDFNNPSSNNPTSNIM